MRLDPTGVPGIQNPDSTSSPAPYTGNDFLTQLEKNLFEKTGLTCNQEDFDHVLNGTLADSLTDFPRRIAAWQSFLRRRGRLFAKGVMTETDTETWPRYVWCIELIISHYN